MTTKSSDLSEAAINWASDEVAEHWSRNQARRDEHIGPATEMMVDLAGLRPGHRVLDVAAGTGGQTFVSGSTGRSERLRLSHRPFFKDAELGSRHRSKGWAH
jgi:ubiquinone/menaquinone biosynthesis C-methylase UbiE